MEAQAKENKNAAEELWRAVEKERLEAKAAAEAHRSKLEAQFVVAKEKLASWFKTASTLS
mgnify:CR=1 FL=1